MAHSALTQNPSNNIPSEALQEAELRAQKAERTVEQLERKIEALEIASETSSSRLSNSVHRSTSDTQSTDGDTQAIEALRQDGMMEHLLNALHSGQDIGHYGRLVFAMVAHHFLSEDAMLDYLAKDPGITQEEAVALLRQVEGRDYNPPRRQRILEWQAQQEFPILPHPNDPDCGNVYRNLKFPQSVYEHIQEYQEEKVQVDDQASERADSR